MSRAFVRESDDRPELPMARPSSALPEGAKNYLTPGGAIRFREELRQLVETKRPALVRLTTDAEVKRQLLILDQRIQHLEEILQSAEVVPPNEGSPELVRFGATVTVRRVDGEEDSYRIVGIDEIDLGCSWVSWASPIARALLKTRVGDRVRFKFPSGEEELEVLKIEYENL